MSININLFTSRHVHTSKGQSTLGFKAVTLFTVLFFFFLFLLLPSPVPHNLCRYNTIYYNHNLSWHFSGIWHQLWTSYKFELQVQGFLSDTVVLKVSGHSTKDIYARYCTNATRAMRQLRRGWRGQTLRYILRESNQRWITSRHDTLTSPNTNTTISQKLWRNFHF